MVIISIIIILNIKVLGGKSLHILGHDLRCIYIAHAFKKWLAMKSVLKDVSALYDS